MNNRKSSVFSMAIILSTAIAVVAATPEPSPNEEADNQEALVCAPGTSFDAISVATGRSLRYSGPARDRSGEVIGPIEPTDFDLKEVGQFRKLESLTLYGNGVSKSGLLHLKNCQSLNYFSHGGMQRADELVPVLCEVCPNIEQLILPGSDVSKESADAIASLKRLKKLDLSRTRITSAFFRDRRFSESLSDLKLSDTEVDSSVISELPRTIRRLELHRTKVDAKAISSLLECRHLDVLIVPYGTFSFEEVENLRKGLPTTTVNGKKHAG